MSTKIKVPAQLYREAEVRMEGEGEKRSLTMSISSDKPYKRYDWWNDKEYYEVIDHSPGGIDESRLKAGLPILFNHDRDQHLGTARSYSIDGHKCTVSNIQWSSSDLAQEKKADAESGALSTTSVGYRLLDEGECVGAQDGIPIYKFKVEVFEGSLVTIPADISVGVGRSKEAETRDFIEVNIRGTETILNPEKKGVDNSLISENKRASIMSDVIAPSTEQPKIEVVREAESRGAKQERERIQGISDLSGHFATKGLAGKLIDTSEAMAKAIKEGWTVDQFQNDVVRGNFKEPKPVEVAPELGMSKKEVRNFSFCKAILAIGTQRKFDGLEKDASDATAKLLGREVDGPGFFIPEDIMRAPAFSRGISEAQLAEMPAHTRALFTNVYSGAGAFVGTDLMPTLIELLRNEMAVVRMGARTLSGVTGPNIAIPRQTGGATASWLAEDSTASRSQQTVGQLALTPHNLVASTAYTQQLLVQSSLDIENFVRQDLAAVIALKRDLGAISGSGVAGEPKGITAHANTTELSIPVTLSAAQSMTYANAVQFETNVALNNANKGKLGYITTPTVKGRAKLIAEIQSTNSIPVWKDDKVNGYPAFATNQVPTATSVIYGNWDDLVLVDWAGTSVLVDPYSLSLQRQISVLLSMYCDNGLRHAASFSVSTN